MKTSRSLIRIINSLEGYCIALEQNKLEGLEKECLQYLMINTIQTATLYGYDVKPYKKWYVDYLSKTWKKSVCNEEL